MKIPVMHLLPFLLFSCLASCMYPDKNFTERSLVIARNETVFIKEIGLALTNKGCGRQWTGEGTEKPYCGLEVKINDSVYHFGDSFEPFYIRNIELRIDKMNPWNVVEDSVPPGGCRVSIKKLADGSR